jgi:hypothetical protein
MITERGIIRPASSLDEPQPLRLRRAAVLRVMLHPAAAARALDGLAAESDLRRLAVGCVLRACARTHYRHG